MVATKSYTGASRARSERIRVDKRPVLHVRVAVAGDHHEGEALHVFDEIIEPAELEDDGAD